MINKEIKKIAILGATSHIAKGLIENFSKTREYELYLYARSTEKVIAFLEERRLGKVEAVDNFDKFTTNKYDVVINCVGVGQPEKIKEVGFDIFKLTEEFDNLAINYLQENHECLYVSLSSGAVYGKNFTSPVSISSPAIVDINNLSPIDSYGLAKLCAEAKHRALVSYNIVDLRIFSYFSQDINLKSKFLLSEIITSIENNKPLITTKNDIVRDYIHPLDLFDLITLCFKKQRINDVFDAYSKKPVAKFELFDFLAKQYNFKYKVKRDINKESSTGAKNVYYSINHKAKAIGYSPKYTSLEAISDECSKLIRRNHG